MSMFRREEIYGEERPTFGRAFTHDSSSLSDEVRFDYLFSEKGNEGLSYDLYKRKAAEFNEGEDELRGRYKKTILRRQEGEVRSLLSGVKSPTAILNRLFGTRVSILGDRDADSLFNDSLRKDMVDSLLNRGQEEESAIPYYNYFRDALDYTQVNAIDDAKRFRNNTFSTSSVINRLGSLSRVKKILDNTSYITRPGIAHAAMMIESSQFELSFDIYQLQNSTIQDLITLKVIDKAREYKASLENGEPQDKFRLNIRLAMPSSGDSTSANILGPNILFYRRINILKQMYGEDVDINFRLGSAGNHPKVIATEDFISIGTQNLTTHIGKFINQVGSNYEAVRILHFSRDENIPQANRLAILRAIRESSRERLYEDLKQALGISTLTGEQKLFLQAKTVIDRNFREESTLTTGMENIAAPDDSRKHLFLLLDEVYQNKNARIDFIFDQPGILKMFSSSSQNSDYQRKKEQFAQLIIEGRASGIIDVRNYRQQLANPLYEKISSTSSLLQEFNYDLDRAVSRLSEGDDFDSRVNSLLRGMNQYSSSSFSREDALTLMMLTSGNIKQANVPRQHVKAYVAYEGDKILGSKIGSSNSSLRSLGLSQDNNYELDLIFLHESLRDRFIKSDLDPTFVKQSTSDVHDRLLSLSMEENEIELANQADTIRRMQSDLGHRKDSIIYNNVDNRAQWERNVDRLKLEELYEGLKNLNKSVGYDVFRVDYAYTGASPSSVLVTFNPQTMGLAEFASEAKLKFEFTVMQTGASSSFKKKLDIRDLSDEALNPLVLEVRKSKLIGFSEVLNKTDIPLQTGFNRNGEALVINPDTRSKLTPIETTISMMSSLAYQTANRIFIEAPKTRYAYVASTEYGVFNLLSRYMLRLAGREDLNNVDILDPNKITASDIKLIAERFYSRFRNDISGISLSHDLRSVRQLSKIDPTRDDEIASLASLIKLMGDSRMGVAERAYLMGLGRGENYTLSSIDKILEAMLSDPEGRFSDILYDMMSGVADGMYRNELRESIKDNVARVFTPFIMPTQQRTYSSTQGVRRRAVFGYTKEKTVSNINSGEVGLRSLLAYSAVMNPLSYNPTTYFGKGSRPMFREVAGGGGPLTDEREEAGLYNTYVGFEGGVRVNRIGTETGIEIIQDTGVGFIIGKNSIQSYLDSIAHLDKYQGGINLKALEDKLQNGEIFIFNFDRVKKVAQILQRIKNAIGTRPLYDVSKEYQYILDSFNTENLEKLRYFSRFTANSVLISGSNPVKELESAYLNDLVDSMKSAGIQTDVTYKHLLDRGYSIGALDARQIKPALSRELAMHLELMRAEMIEEFFKGQDLFNDSNEITRNIANELFRAKLVLAEIENSGLRGLLGSSNRTGPPQILMQLSGAYSDPYYANPYFGSVDIIDGGPTLRGLRQAFLDRAVKKVKSSHLKVTIDSNIYSWHLDENIQVRPGDVIAFDESDNRMWVYSTENGVRVKRNVIDDRSQFKLVTNIIDSRGEVPIMAFNTATSANTGLIGEHGVEVVREIRVLNGNPETSELSFEIIFDRTLLPGSVRRGEAVVGLFKGVPIHLYGSIFEDVVENLNRQRVSNLRKLKSSQVQGLGSISNFKSYFFEHGSVLLTRRELMNDLLSNISDARLAGSILMGIGDPQGTIGRDKVEVGKAFVEAVENNLLGSAVKSKLNMYKLNSGTFRNGGYSDDFYTGIYKEFAMSMDKTSEMQMPSMRLIDSSTIISALRGQGAELRRRVNDILSDPLSTNLKSSYLIIDDLRGREMATLAGGIDLMNQMFGSEIIELPIIGDLKRMLKSKDTKEVNEARKMIKQLAIAANLTTDEVIDEDQTTMLGLLLQKAATNSHVLSIYSSINASQSKVPLSSKLSANVELQHILGQSFTINKEVFKRGGTADQLRGIMATVLGAMVGSGGDVMLSATEKMEIIDITSPYARSPFFKSMTLGVYNNELEGSSSLSSKRSKYKTLHNLFLLHTSSTPTKNYYTSIVNFLNKGSAIKDAGSFSKLQSIASKLASGGDNFENLRLEFEVLLLEEIDNLKSGIRKSFEQFALESNKSVSIDAAEAMMRGMAGAKRFGFTIPYFETIGGITTFYKDRVKTGLSLSGEDVQLIGAQYGEFMSEIASDMKEIWLGLAEGSVVNDIFNKVAYGFMTGRDEVSINLNEDELRHIESFYQTSEAFAGNLVRAFAGSQAQRISGAKMPMPGGVFTGAASWLMPSDLAVLPQEIKRRFGAYPSLARKKSLKKVSSNIHSVSGSMNRIAASLKNKYAAIKGLSEEDRDTDFHRQLLKDFTSEKEILRDLSRDREYLIYQARVITGSISPAGSIILDKIINSSIQLRSNISSISSEAEADGVIDNISTQINALQSLDINKRTHSGDYFIKLLGIREMQVLQGAALSFRVSSGHKATKEEAKIIALAKRHLRTGTSIAGLTLSSESDWAKRFFGDISKENNLLIDPRTLSTEYRKGSLGIGIGDEIKNLTDASSAVSNLVNYIEEVRNSYRYYDINSYNAANLDSKFQPVLHRLSTLQRRIDKGVSGTNGKRTSIDMIKLDLEVEVGSLMTELSLSRALMWRSPPPGSHGLLNSVFNIMDLEDFDNYASRIISDTDPSLRVTSDRVRFTPKSGGGVNRNKTLGLFNPITYLVSQLGDWDGDSISTVIDYSVIARQDIFKRSERVNSYRRELESVRESLSNDENNTLLIQRASELEGSIHNELLQVAELKENIRLNENRFNIKEIREAATKWVGNYIGVDPRMFLGSDYGGFSKENGGAGVDFETLFLFIEQGRGLTGGIENLFGMEEVREGQGLGRRTSFSDLQDLVRSEEHLMSTEAFSHRLHSIQGENKLAVALRQDDSMAEHFRLGILANYIGGDNTEEGLTEAIQTFFASQMASEDSINTLQKYLGRAYGTALNEQQFELLSNTIGKAGSSVLGKTYNTTIGLLYTQSPILALSNLVISDEIVRDSVKNTLGDQFLGDLEKNAREARATSERMGGFLQTIHQLMRDSIKPKGNIQEYINKLDDAFDRVAKAKDDEERLQIIDSISREFGTGVGLRALMNLDTFFKGLGQLRQEANREEGRIAHRRIYDNLGISTQVESNLSTVLGFKKIDIDDTGRPTYGEEGIRRPLVAAYKTKMDLLSIAASFKLEKMEGSSYREMRRIFNSSMESMDDIERAGMQSSLNSLIDFAESGDSAAVDELINARGINSSVASRIRSNYLLREGIKKRQKDLITLGLSQGRALTEDERIRYEYGEFLRSLGSEDAGIEDPDRFIADLSKDSLFSRYSSMNTDEKMLVAHVFLREKGNIESFAGSDGGRLMTFADFDHSRREAYNGTSGGGGDLGWDISKSSKAFATWMAIVSGKVPENKFAEFLTGLINVRKYSKKGEVSTKDILLDLMQVGLVDTVASDEGTPGTQFITGMRRFINSLDSVDGILERLRGTAFASTIKNQTDFTRATLREAQPKEKAVDKLARDFGLDVEEARSLYNSYMMNYTNFMTNPNYQEDDLLRSAYMEARDGWKKPTNAPEYQDSGFFKAVGNSTDVAAEAILFPVLALLGNAIANGSVDPEAFQSSIGNAFSALIYNRPYMQGKGKLLGVGVNALAGTGYKTRFIAQAEDPGKELVATVARELTSALTVGMLTDPITKGVSQLLGSKPTFDVDSLEGIRAGASSALSMISTGMLATLLGNNSYRRVKNYQASNIEQSISNLNSDKQRIEREAQSRDVDIETENGIVQYEISYSFSTDPAANISTYEAIVAVDNGFEESIAGSEIEGYFVEL